MENKERSKLGIGTDGVLTEVGKVIDLTDIGELQSIDYIPSKGELVVQPLSDKEIVTPGGVIIPKGTSKEFKAAVVCAGEDCQYQRGDVIRLEHQMFPQGVPVDYIDGKPVLQIPNHYVRGKYPNLNLAEWKKN